MPIEWRNSVLFREARLLLTELYALGIVDWEM
jgi:hypothetical protein